MQVSNTFRLFLCLINFLPFIHSLPNRPSSSSSFRPLASSSPSNSTYVTTISRPIAAAWMYLSDDLNYTSIPPKWQRINFTSVDLLLIGPVGIQEDGTFGLYSSNKTGPIAHRFHWTIERARAHNPNIKIFASQFWGGNPRAWGNDLSALHSASAIEKYATSVKTFMTNWKHVEGYDVDYESTNVRDSIGDILKQVRTTLDDINDGRKFYISVSPASTTHLKAAVPALSFVNMQSYSGGISLTAKDFLDLGLKPHQLLYGYNAEIPQQSHSIPETEKAYKDGHLAGIHVWRLDSSDTKAEGDRFRQIAEFLHKGDNSTRNSP